MFENDGVESRKRNLEVPRNYIDSPEVKRPHTEGGRVLLVTVSNMQYPVDVDLMHFLFKKYGDVLRIALFNRKEAKDNNSGIQALIEFADAEGADSALQRLNGKCIYAGCNELDVS
eukprot:GHVR01177566.1.p1 GENE.GHVR01177566.1~~GHVR01177566.1.p1  ORF type:complete len:116 (-),score=15.70 GHVR01177566.1:318-665(-)